MVSFTSQGRQRCLEHILIKVLGHEISSPLFKVVLLHFGSPKKLNVMDFFMLDNDTIMNFGFEEKAPDPGDAAKTITTTHDVPMAAKYDIVFFKRYIEYMKHNGTVFSQQEETTFLAITRDDYENWKSDTMATDTAAPRPLKTRDQVADFKKGIK